MTGGMNSRFGMLEDYISEVDNKSHRIVIDEVDNTHSQQFQDSDGEQTGRTTQGIKFYQRVLQRFKRGRQYGNCSQKKTRGNVSGTTDD